MTSRSSDERRQVECITCGYHYRAKTMLATERGYRCTDVLKCNGNIARQAWYRRGR